MGIVLGFLGAFYNKMLLLSQAIYRKASFLTPKTSVIVPFVLAGILGVSFPIALGGGHSGHGLAHGHAAVAAGAGHLGAVAAHAGARGAGPGAAGHAGLRPGGLVAAAAAAVVDGAAGRSAAGTVCERRPGLRRACGAVAQHVGADGTQALDGLGLGRAGLRPLRHAV